MPGDPGHFYTLQEICVLLNLLPNTFRQIAREYPDLVEVHKQVRKGRTLVGLPAAEFEVFRRIVQMRAGGASPEEIREAAAVARACAPEVAVPEPASEAGPGPDGGGRPERQPTPLPGDTGPVAEGAAGEAEAAAAGEPARPGTEGLPEEVTEPSEPQGLGVSRRGGGAGGAESGDLERELAAEIASLKAQLAAMEERRREERDRLISALMRTQHELQSLRYEVGVSLSRRERKKRRGFWAWLFDL